MQGFARKLSFDCVRSVYDKQVIFLILLSLLCIMAATQVSDGDTSAALQSVSESSLKFTNSLYKILSREKGNVFFSPISIEVILALAYMGAKGQTAQQMASGLHLTQDKDKITQGFKALMSSLKGDGKVTLEIANNVYAEQTFPVKADFVKTAKDHFLSEVESVNFMHQWEAARQKINQWVESKTNNKIKNLIADGVLSSETVMVLVNAIYFKGNWANKFMPTNTTEQPFHVSAKETKPVQMMFLKKKFGFTEHAELDCKVLEMPYEGGNLSLVVLLPNQVEGLAKLEAKLPEVNLKELVDTLGHVEVEVSFPKFKLEQTIDLKTVLVELGMVDMFDTKADFSGITDQAVSISKVIHKAFIEVNEEGTEAAAATAMIMCMRMAIYTPEFRADRPFVFAIVNKADTTPLFYGRYSQPE